MNRCINIDWLEVYCLEPQDLYGNGVITSSYLAQKGYIVKSRDYGTPTYNEMLFVAVEDDPDCPFLEIRRSPRKDKNGGSFLHPASCHLRLTNKFCYAKYPIIILCEFMIDCGYFFQNIKRIDLALDFNFFDDGENPAFVLRDFMTEKISKINQSKVSGHGADSWDGRAWNSVRWGSPTSNIVTRFYNKSLELKQSKMKTYIQDAWKDSGLRADIPVWRVEFQIKAGQKGFENARTQEFYNMHISTFDSRSKQLFVFHSLAQKYFHFKYREKNTDGTWKRKDRCRDKPLFKLTAMEKIYIPRDTNRGNDPTRMDKILMRKCLRMQDDVNTPDSVKDAALTLARHLEYRFYGYIFG